jgi:AcrR family transcriptional regulator
MAAPRRAPRRTGSHETRAALLDAAARVFVERGLHGATVREIAGRAGFTNPVLYYHFGGKEELYDAVIRTAFERFRTLLSEALEREAKAEPLARLRAIITAYLRFGRDDPVQLRTLYAEFFRPRTPQPDPRFDEIRGWAIEHIEAVLREGARTGVLPATDVALARRMFVALLGGLLVEQARDPKLRVLDEGLVDTVIGFFLHGVASLEATT